MMHCHELEIDLDYIINKITCSRNGSIFKKFCPAFSGDTCCFFFSMGHIKKIIEERIPGIYVRSLMIGDNIIAVS